jgi:hypothetical protein
MNEPRRFNSLVGEARQAAGSPIEERIADDRAQTSTSIDGTLRITTATP